MPNLANIHFIYPEWFLALIPLVVLWWFFAKNHKFTNNWQNIIDKHLLLKLSGSNSKQKKLKYLPLLVASILILSIFALSGPSFFQEKSPLYQLQKLQVVLLDASDSTYANDIKPSRFKRSILLIKQLLKQTKEGEIMLIAFSGEPYIISPPTNDKKPITNLLDGFNQKILPVSGQNLNLALKYTKNIISKYKNKSIDILLLTDDDIVGSASLKTAKQLYQQGFKLSVLSVSGDKDILINDNNINKANTRLLQLLAKNGGGIYQKLSNDVIDIKNYLNFTKQHLAQKNKKNSKQIKTWVNSGIYLVFVLLVLVGLLFRGGYFLNIAIFVLLFSDPSIGYTSSSYLNNMWQTNDAKAKQYYKDKQYQKAATIFNNKAWQANALYKAGNYEASAKLFKELGENYNYANSLAKQAKYEEALRIYDSIKINKAKKNLKDIENLEKQGKYQQAHTKSNLAVKDINLERAKHNANIIRKILKQQKQEQQNKDNKNKDKQQKQQQKNQQQNNTKQNKKNQNKQQQNQQQQKKDNKENKQNPQQNNQKQDKKANDKQQNKNSKDKKNENEDKNKKAKKQQTKTIYDKDKENKQKTKQQKLQEVRLDSQIKKQKLEQVFKKIKTKPINLLQQKFIIERRQRLENNSKFINNN